MIRMSVPQIVLMQDALIREIGGLAGIWDERLLDLALNSPFQTFDGEFHLAAFTSVKGSKCLESC